MAGEARGFEDIMIDRRVLDWGDRIIKLEPDADPLCTATRKLAKEKAVNQVFTCFEDKPWTRWMYIHGSPSGSTDAYDIHLDDGSGTELYQYIQKNDILWDYTNGDMFLVSAVNRSTGVISVIINYSDAGTANINAVAYSGKRHDTSDTTDSGLAAPQDGDRILKLSNSFADGGSKPTNLEQALSKVTNFCQKFWKTWAVDNEVITAEMNGENEIARLMARKLIENAKDVEYQFLFGKADARVEELNSTGKYQYTTAGLWNMGLTKDDIGGTLTETGWRSWLRTAFEAGDLTRKNRLFLAGGLVAEGLDIWGLGRMRYDEEFSGRLGITVTAYEMAGIRIPIVRHPLLIGTLQGVGCLVDLDSIKFKVFRDWQVKTAVQDNGADERIDMALGQFGLKLGLVENHRWLYGVDAVA